MPVIIDGKATAARCNEETACEIAALRTQGITPGLCKNLLTIEKNIREVGFKQIMQNRLTHHALIAWQLCVN